MIALLDKILDGRPMKQIEPRGNLRYMPFRDVVSGKMVWYWEDRMGRVWLAEDRWGWFRMLAKCGKGNTND
jgi:hypothetical protein